MSKTIPVVLSLGLSVCVIGPSLAAEAPATAPAGPGAAISDQHRQTARKLMDDGVKFLLSKREADGGWSIGQGAAKPAATAMVVSALLRSGRYDAQSPEVKKGFEVLLSFRQPNGGIYNPKEGQENYTTAVALMALVAAKDPQYQSAIGDAIRYMKGLQIVPGSESPDKEKIDEKHPFVAKRRRAG